MTDAEDLSALAGPAAVLVSIVAILGATVVSPTFAWTASALSDLGAAGAPTAPLFNGGLVATGLLAVGFVPALWAGAESLPERGGAVAFGLASVALAGVGLFPIGTDPHVPAAVGFYLLVAATLVLWGTGRLLAGDRRRAAFALGLAVAELGAWVVWAATGEFFRPGLALPETVGAVAFGAWTVATARRLR